jgi:hypothetical protein
MALGGEKEFHFMKFKENAMKICLLALLGLSAVALAQRPFPYPGAFQGPPRAKLVTNAPYSGVGVTTSKRTLIDGNTIAEESCVKVYRDNAGRTRQEETRNSSTCSATPQSILLSDPVAGVGYAIDAQNNTYRQFSAKPPAGAAPLPGHHPPNDANQVQTLLGAQPITGTPFTAEGTQTVTTIPAGQWGNAQPITITSIRWYSQDLQIVIQSSRSDPRGGVTTYQLSDVSTAEPAESLFQLPTGLTLQQGPPERGRRAH